MARLASVDVLAKVTIGATPTQFSDQVSAVWRVSNRVLEAMTTGTSSWVGRDYEFSDGQLEIGVLQPTTTDTAIETLEAAAIARTKVTMTLVEPSLKTHSGSFVITEQENNASVNSYYEKSWTLLPDGAITRS